MPEPKAHVERKPLEPEDVAVLAAAHQRLHSMGMLGVIGGILFALAAWYMHGRGQATDAYASVVAALLFWVCAISLAFAARRDAKQATKDIITGVIGQRKAIRSRYNVFYYLEVGGIDVAVPPTMFTQFQEGQTVCVERTTGSRSFLRIRESKTDAR